MQIFETITHVYFSALFNDSRSYRAAKAALDAGMSNRVIVIGYQEDDLQERESVSPRHTIIRIKVPKIRGLPRVVRRSLEWMFWCRRVVSQIRASDADVIQCHSLAALLPCVIAKRRLGNLPLLYDARELETEREGWSRFQKFVARLVESALIGAADRVLVVSEHIANWYREKYHLSNVFVVRNVPIRAGRHVKRNRQLRDELGIADEEQIFLYLGAISEGRGYRQIVDAFKKMPPDRHAVFVGDGPASTTIAELAKSHANIHWRPPVPIMEVVHYAAGADVGLCFIEDTCLSHRYCLPNKLHEYRLGGLPVIVSDLPELALFVRETKCGWVTDSSGAGLEELLMSLDRQTIEAKLAGIEAAPLTWEDEVPRYLNILDGLPSRHDRKQN